MTMRWLRTLAFMAALAAMPGEAPAQPVDLFVANFGDSSVRRYNGATGAPVGTGQFIAPNSGGLNRTNGLTFNNGFFYVSSLNSNEVLRYNLDGSFNNVFVGAGSGGLSTPAALTFGPNGNLFVSDRNNDVVRQYNGTTGAFIGNFAGPGSVGNPNRLDNPDGLVFRGGFLYVSSSITQEVKRYDGTTGAFVDNFIAAGSGGLAFPQGLVFGPDNNLYVADGDSAAVRRYNGTTGSFIDTLNGNGLNTPTGVAFGPDGRLYVSSTDVSGTPIDPIFSNNRILAYNFSTSQFDTFVSANSGGLNGPTYLIFAVPEPTSLVLIGLAGAAGAGVVLRRRLRTAA